MAFWRLLSYRPLPPSAPYIVTFCGAGGEEVEVPLPPLVSSWLKVEEVAAKQLKKLYKGEWRLPRRRWVPLSSEGDVTTFEMTDGRMVVSLLLRRV